MTEPGRPGQPGAPSGPGAPGGAAAAPPVDLPPVPRGKRSALTLFALIFGGLVTAGYAATAATDYEPGAPARDTIPPSVRSAGGYRSFHFWHTGYHGGK